MADDKLVINMDAAERERRKQAISDARATLSRTAEIGEPDYLAAALARPVEHPIDRDRRELGKFYKNLDKRRDAEAERKRREIANSARRADATVTLLAKATATMAAETAAEIDRLYKLISKLTTRLAAVEQRPSADFAAMQNTAARMDKTLSEFQSVMTRYFESNRSGGGSIIDLPVSRRN